jgi:hypothetical protein
MPNIALRPRSPTELVDAAFQLYRAEPVPFITGMALVYVPFLLIVAFSGGSPMSVDSATSASGSMDVLVMGTRAAVVSIASMVAYLLAGGLMAVLASDAYLGRPLDLGRAVRAVIGGLIALFISGFVTGVVIVIGLMLLIIPAFYFYGRLFATKQAVLLEGAGPMGALDRSWNLTKGHVAHILGTMALVFLLNFAVYFGATFISLLLPGQILRALLNIVVAVLIYPIAGITETLLYYDVRIRREGFDIEYLAAAAPVAPGFEGPR